MIKIFKGFFILFAIFWAMVQNTFALIGPVRILPSGSVLLVSSEDIKMTREKIELYHHPLGIWLVECEVLLQNLRAQEMSVPVGFPAGFDIRLVEGDLYCDRFDNFQVFENNQKVSDLNFMQKCANYVETTGTQWSVDDGAGIGFLNTWIIKFRTDESKRIKITFHFIVKKPPVVFNPNIKETWYSDLMNWMREDYSYRQENHFALPINIGSFWAFYPDTLTIRSYIASDWFDIVKESDRSYQKDFVKQYEFSEPVGFYTPPEIALDSLSINQLQEISATKLIILRNSFFAKYGRKFEVSWLKQYFEKQPWYQENRNYHNWYLTQLDLDHIKKIYQFEKRIEK
jgi:hypothetical protein